MVLRFYLCINGFHKHYSCVESQIRIRKGLLITVAAVQGPYWRVPAMTSSISEDKKFSVCPECGGLKLVTDVDTGEMVCESCGYVLPENLAESTSNLKQVSTLSHNVKIWQQIEEEERKAAAAVAKIRLLKSMLVGLPIIPCRRCGKSIPWKKGRKYCLDCALTMRGLSKKRYVERNLKKTQLSSKLGMRDLRLRRKLAKDKDLAKVNLRPEKQRDYQRRSMRSVNEFINTEG